MPYKQDIDWDLLHQFLVFEPLWSDVPHTAFLVLLVLRVGSFKEIHLGITFKGKDMCGNPVQEPAVVRNHYGTSGEILQALFKGAYSIYIHIIGRLVKKQHVTFILQRQGKMEPVPFSSGKYSAEFLLVRTGKIESGDIRPGIYILLAELYEFASA
jgi:hypothetical protein